MAGDANPPSVAPVDAPVVIAGAGPTGLTTALVLAEHGIASTLADDDVTYVTSGSRSICVQGHTLAILRRLGVDGVAREGVQWTRGRTYHRNREILQNRIPAEGAGSEPRFVNLAQSRVEKLLADAVEAHPLCRVEWGTTVTGVEQDEQGVTVTATGPAGPMRWRAAYAVGADGAHSAVRQAVGIPFVAPDDQPDHTDAFLVVDVRADLPYPAERRFFFDPPWNPGRQVLVHPQPDGIWRIDWQVPEGFDLEAERANGQLDHRVRQVLGESTQYDIAWTSVYKFRQRLAARFRVGRVFLAGDAAHTMSVFGARGMNSGIQDADNLGWKIAYALRGGGGDLLLDSYEEERRAAAEENLAVTGATTRFMAPPTGGGRLRRKIILTGAPYAAWFRRRVDSGKLSEPAVYRSSSVVQPGCGALAPDLPVRPIDKPGSELVELRRLRGGPYVVAAIGPTVEEAIDLARSVAAAAVAATDLPPHRFVAGAAATATGDTDTAGAALGNLLVVRPDGHLAWKVNGEPPPDEVAAALAEALRRAAGLDDVTSAQSGA